MHTENLRNPRNWTLHVSDGTAQVSYRLLPSLRLLALGDNELHPPDDPVEPRLELWKKQVIGVMPYDPSDETTPADVTHINSEWEHAMCHLLLSVCGTLYERAQNGLEQVELVRQRFLSSDTAQQTESLRYSLRCLQVLWTEEASVAVSVKDGIIRGSSFW